MQSLIHSTCCSIGTTILHKTEGLPGPVIVNKFGNPETCIPKKVFGPSLQTSFNFKFCRPLISIFKRGPVIASKPVAYTNISSSYSLFFVFTP